MFVRALTVGPVEFCELMAAECRRRGDRKNYYRWRCVGQDHRYALRQLPLF